MQLQTCGYTHLAETQLQTSAPTLQHDACVQALNPNEMETQLDYWQTPPKSNMEEDDSNNTIYMHVYMWLEFLVGTNLMQEPRAPVQKTMPALQEAQAVLASYMEKVTEEELAKAVAEQLEAVGMYSTNMS